MILTDFVLLASDTTRTKAYLQRMIAENKLPALCIVYTDDYNRMVREVEEYKEPIEEPNYFDENQPVLYSICRAGIKYHVVNNKDINSDEMINVIKKLEQTYLIYSGYGGYILKNHLFNLGKKIIHVHAGVLPQYRGSTTAYYSLLQENILGASAIFLSEGIDEGEVITKEIYEIPKERVNIDYVYEPYIRSRVLLKAIDIYLEKKMLECQSQCEDGAEIYYIIHPVLKHLAILKMEDIWDGRR